MPKLVFVIEQISYITVKPSLSKCSHNKKMANQRSRKHYCLEKARFFHSIKDTKESTDV